MCRLEIEHDQVGQVCSVFVFSSENEKLVSLIEVCGVTFPISAEVFQKVFINAHPF